MSGILYIVLVGFVAGIIARLVSPGPNNPSGFILTTVLGIGGAFVATFIGQAVGHYGPNQGAGFITATLGALVVLFVWNRLVARRMISDPGGRTRV
ncbi:GlsB/YeaQ/YmgE family stress response membrane protein [Rhodopseudomonas palustris]|uniref:GlsB/YeaQ/YmgE family stress response membrane protein n=1 Tax=Rhodopseudomonas palustris (strain BisB18) TaxID=316056 RepID=Q21BV7_RHOPB